MPVRAATTALLLSMLAWSPLAFSADPDASREAVGELLFDLDIENASFKVRHDGHVDILFGRSLSDEQYRNAIGRLKADPRIPGVLAGRGSGDFCPVP